MNWKMKCYQIVLANYSNLLIISFGGNVCEMYVFYCNLIVIGSMINFVSFQDAASLVSVSSVPTVISNNCSKTESQT